MNLVLIIAIFGLQTTLILMWVFTLNKKLNSLEQRIEAINTHVDGQAERINANFEEKAQFNEKALGTLAQNIALCGYEVKEVKDKIEIVNKTIKDESAKNIAMHLRKF